MDKKRVIVDYKNITLEHLELLLDNFPSGIDDTDTIKFTNSKGETVSAIPLETADTKYLFKVSVEAGREGITKKMDNFRIENEDGETKDFEEDED